MFPFRLRLAVTPQITDVGTVILKVVAENNSVSTGGSGGGSATDRNSENVNSKFLVPDGGTTVVGGALFDQESENQTRTPGLSRIPLLGYLFKRKSVQRDTNEILFFITPRIYRPDFQGRPTSGKVSDKTRSTTILQPVPLGNPASNSDPVQPQQNNNNTQPNVNPVVPYVPTVTPQSNPNQPSLNTKP